MHCWDRGRQRELSSRFVALDTNILAFRGERERDAVTLGRCYSMCLKNVSTYLMRMDLGIFSERPF
jgi:hypothetical protein